MPGPGCLLQRFSRLGAASRGAKTAIVQGFNVYHWAQDGLDFWAVSDIAAGELNEFAQKFRAALQPSPAPS